MKRNKKLKKLIEAYDWLNSHTMSQLNIKAEDLINCGLAINVK